MKLDDFEKYVFDNKHDFGPDHEVPDVWGKVQKREPEEVKLKISWRQWTRRAASITVIFTISYFIHDFRANRLNGDSTKMMKMVKKDPRILQLIEADEFYTAEINIKKEELFRLGSNVPGLENEINTDLADLDAILIELKEDLEDNADNEEVIAAMMQNYRLKLEILEDMLEQFKNKKIKTDKHEEGVSI